MNKTETIEWYSIIDKKPPSGLGVLISNESDLCCVFAMWNPEKCFWGKVDEPFRKITNFEPSHWAFLPEGVSSIK